MQTNILTSLILKKKEEKLDALVFLKNQILRKAEKLEIK